MSLRPFGLRAWFPDWLFSHEALVFLFYLFNFNIPDVISDFFRASVSGASFDDFSGSLPEWTSVLHLFVHRLEVDSSWAVSDAATRFTW